MNNETTQPAITVEDLKKRKSDILAEIDRLQSRLGEVEYWMRKAVNREVGSLRELFVTVAADLNLLNVMTPLEEAAAKERAMKAHADELAKGSKALDDAITQVERKNGKPKLRDDSRNYYGLVPGKRYNQGQIASSKLWGWTMGRRLSKARTAGKIRYKHEAQTFTYAADDLIAWREKEGK